MQAASSPELQTTRRAIFTAQPSAGAALHVRSLQLRCRFYRLHGTLARDDADRFTRSRRTVRLSDTSAFDPRCTGQLIGDPLDALHATRTRPSQAEGKCPTRVLKQTALQLRQTFATNTNAMYGIGSDTAASSDPRKRSGGSRGKVNAGSGGPRTCGSSVPSPNPRRWPISWRHSASETVFLAKSWS